MGRFEHGQQNAHLFITSRTYRQRVPAQPVFCATLARTAPRTRSLSDRPRPTRNFVNYVKGYLPIISLASITLAFILSYTFLISVSLFNAIERRNPPDARSHVRPSQPPQNARGWRLVAGVDRTHCDRGESLTTQKTRNKNDAMKELRFLSSESSLYESQHQFTVRKHSETAIKP